MFPASILKNITGTVAISALIILFFSCIKIDNNLQLGSGEVSFANTSKAKPNIIIIILIDDNGYELLQYTGGQHPLINNYS